MKKRMRTLFRDRDGNLYDRGQVAPTAEGDRVIHPSDDIPVTPVRVAVLAKAGA
jgi:hypothetical protein